MIQGLQLGFELTFIPNKRGKWKEYRDEQQAIDVASGLTKLLAVDQSVKVLASFLKLPPSTPIFTAKADLFRAMWDTDANQPHAAWCIEVNNTPVTASAIEVSSPRYLNAFQAVYDRAKQWDLHPHIERRSHGALLDYPTGGGHIHFSIGGLWHGGYSYLDQLRLLEFALCLDYANNPWMRWLFAQWSDNINSNVAITDKVIRQVACKMRHKRFTRSQMARWAYGEALECAAIKQRFAYTGKSVYPTYELRFFDMPRNVAELKLQASFVHNWVETRVRQIDEISIGGDDGSTRKGRKQAAALLKKVLSYRLDGRQWRKLTTDRKYARGCAASFMDSIGVTAGPVLDAFWERNYVRRARWGKFM